MKLPKWLSKSTFTRLQTMESEAALEEIERLKSEYGERRRAYDRARYHADVEKSRAASRLYRASIDPKHKKDLEKAKWARQKLDDERIKKIRERSASRRRELGLDKNRVRDRETLREKDRRKRQRIKTQRLARENPAEMRRLIRAHVPGYLIAAAQMDVINSVMVQAIDRKVPFNDLAAWVKKTVTEYNRQFDYFKTVSIDAPIAGTDDLKRSDLIDSEAFHF